MKIFLMYYDRFDEATTSKIISKKHIVLCHDNAKKFTCVGKQGTLIETKQPKGIQNNFNYALNLLETGEWGIFLSDDLTGAKVLKNGKFENAEPNEILNQFIDFISTADKIGVKLVGMNSTGNPFYAKNKFSKYGLVDGRCFAMKKTEFRFHPDINTIPDYYATAYHLKKYGGNIILNQMYLDFKRYGDKGLGPVKERIVDKVKDVKIMLKEFPKNIKIKAKPNEPEGSHIIITR